MKHYFFLGPLTNMTACINSVVKIFTDLLWLTGAFSRPVVVKVSGFSMNVWFPWSQCQESRHLCPSPGTPTPTLPQPAPTDRMALASSACPETYSLFELLPLLHVQEKKQYSIA